jgi:hypothetical protein
LASSTASEFDQEPSDPSAELATQTRVPLTMLNSIGWPKIGAPQPPASAPESVGAARVV